MSTVKLLTVIFSILLFSSGILMAGSASGIQIAGIPLFFLCGVCGFILHWTLFVPAFVFQTERYFDLTGSASFLTTVVLALALNPDPSPLQLLLTILVSIWALRLGYFLYNRIRKAGKDSRFDDIKNKFWRFLLTWTLGGAWVLFTVAAALAAITVSSDREFDLLAISGTILWLIGFVIELIADSQKSRFRSVPENANKFINTGLWSWSRHPNYFGEILLWLGIAIIAFPSLNGWQHLTLISPLFVFILLTRVSGIPLLEQSARKRWGTLSDYQNYVRKTSVLFPVPRVTTKQ